MWRPVAERISGKPAVAPVFKSLLTTFHLISIF
jgi:hypothetical protein